MKRTKASRELVAPRCFSLFLDYVSRVQNWTEIICKLRESFFAFRLMELRGFPQIGGLDKIFPIWELCPIWSERLQVTGTDDSFAQGGRMGWESEMSGSVKRQPVLLVHGGAWAIPASEEEAHERGVRAALEAGWRALNKGGSCVDAVEEAVAVMEDDPTFDAGRGSFLTSDGRVQLDALLMDGGRMKAGGVACVERLRNPIRAARVVLEQSPHVYFVGAGAEQFAAAHGVELIENRELVLDRERERLSAAQERAAAGLRDETFSGELDWDDKSPETAYEGTREQGNKGENHLSHDTVGAVAFDVWGNLAAATSTGGTLNKTPGRVGDSSLIGCGCYADNLSAAVSLTGWGEPIMKLVLGKWATDRVAAGVAPELGAREAIDYLYRRLGGHGGIILLAPDGRWGVAHNTPAMAWGVATVKGMETGLKVQ
jgi:L-asparaginase / beta-aspartyl-peptidase